MNDCMQPKIADGATWASQYGPPARTHINIEPSHQGDTHVEASVYWDGDGPSVRLLPARAREVGEALIARADLLERGGPVDPPTMDGDRCPTCTSTAPHLHPAMQAGGEVQLCPDPWHARLTPQNTAVRRADVDRLLAGPYARAAAGEEVPW